MHAGMCVPLRNTQRDSTFTSSGANTAHYLHRRVSTGKDREPERVRMAQPGSRVSRRESMAGRWRDGPRRAAASRINGLSCRRRCRREGEGKRESGMNYDGSVSQRQENVGRYILRNIPILWAAPAPSDERESVFPPLSGWENFRCVMWQFVVVTSTDERNEVWSTKTEIVGRSSNCRSRWRWNILIKYLHLSYTIIKIKIKIIRLIRYILKKYYKFYKYLILESWIKAITNILIYYTTIWFYIYILSNQVCNANHN